MYNMCCAATAHFTLTILHLHYSTTPNIIAFYFVLCPSHMKMDHNNFIKISPDHNSKQLIHETILTILVPMMYIHISDNKTM